MTIRTMGAVGVAVLLAGCVDSAVRTQPVESKPAPASAPAPAAAKPRTLDLLGALGTNEPAASSPDVSVVRDGGALAVTLRPGADKYPGVTLAPSAGAWDLSAYGHIGVRVANPGTNRMTVSVRVDNAGLWQDKPWSTESASIKPGATGSVTVCFGYAYGKAAFALKPAAIVRVLVFTGKPEAEQSLRIEAVEAAGAPGEKPAIDPNTVRIAPRDGWLLGAGTAVNAATQLVARGAQASVTGDVKHAALRVAFPAAAGEAMAQFKPAVGRWDLREALQVSVTLRNDGTMPVRPRVRLDSNGGPTDWATTPGAMAPGAQAEVVVPFVPAVPWTVLPYTVTNGIVHLGGKPGTGTKFLSDAVSAVVIGAEAGEGERVIGVTAIRAGLPPVPAMPDWLGRRPPVEGEWTMTFDDEFDGTAIDTNRWSVKGDNWYDKVSHYSRDNVIVGGGVARIRYENKRGWHNDDPAYKQWAPAVTGETDYATGYLTSINHWRQRYGYFESRMKLPSAPGLWPAFWTMPDRGPSVTPLSKRGATSDGGMEFDIMEWLSRWGQYRYNIAMHWDGYKDQHKSCGTGTIYVQPDKDGYLTCGLLWTPGVAVYYCNGREVLRWEDPRISSVPAHLLFTQPCGGWDNNAVEDARLPSDFIVDYVRVWQRKDLAGE